MKLASQTRLGPYEIVSPLGAGGLGEVYRARDTRLDRDVAIKVLPAELAQNTQFKLRFEREAKTISQLNHPHICTLHDVGEAELPSVDTDRADLERSRERTVESITCDVRDPASVSAAIRPVELLSRRLDALVYCAGVSRDAVIWKMRVEDWDATQAVNLRGAFLVIQAAIPIMRSAGHGAIVLVV